MSQTYRVRTDETWAQARAAYGAGESAPSVCRRFDLGLSALRKRASKEGWRRADDPDPEVLEFEDLPDRTPGEAIAHAWRWLCHALEEGRSAEAVRWLRLHTQLAQAQQDARRPDPAGADARVHAFHEVHPEFAAATPAPPLAPADAGAGSDGAPDQPVHPFHPFHRENSARTPARVPSPAPPAGPGDPTDDTELPPRNRAERRRYEAERKRLGVRSPPAREDPW